MKLPTSSTALTASLKPKSGSSWWASIASGSLLFYLLLSPVYIFPSGNPQPADLVAVVGLAICFCSLSSKMLWEHRKLLLPASCFALYTCLLTMVWALTLNDFNLFKVPLFYTYNLSMFVFVLWLGQQHLDRLLCTLRYGILGGALLSLVLLASGFGGARSIRSTAGFNNPNQLGYFALMSIASSTILFISTRRGAGAASLSIGASVPLLLASASFAAIGGAFATMGGWLIGAPTIIRRLVPFLCLFAVVGAGVFIAAPKMVDEIAMTLEIRGRSLGKKQNAMVEERGYVRILNHPEYLMFGASEGAYYRFNADHEIHSAIGTLFFCYGLPGGIALCLFLWRVVQGTPLWMRCVLLSPFLYSITHQSLRSTLLWTFLAIVVVLKPRSSAPTATSTKVKKRQDGQEFLSRKYRQRTNERSI